MRYLITFTDGTTPFLTKWFDRENHFTENMIVYDLEFNQYTTNGVDWLQIEEDHL